jgi:hypothetical protein
VQSEALTAASLFWQADYGAAINASWGRQENGNREFHRYESIKEVKMILDFLKKNKKVIAFYILFIVILNLCVIGVCYMIPERLRSGGWFVAPNYQAK